MHQEYHPYGAVRMMCAPGGTVTMQWQMYVIDCESAKDVPC